MKSKLEALNNQHQHYCNEIFKDKDLNMMKFAATQYLIALFNNKWESK
jgi:hypothetical protein